MRSRRTDREFAARFDDLAQVAHRVAFRILGDREEAADVTQETLARALVRWRKVEAKAPAWVARVAANLALDVVRRRGRAPVAIDRTPAATLDATVDRAVLVAAIQSLSRRQREVVVLRYLADLSEREVASTLGCSTGAVKRHAHRGLAALRAELAPTIFVPEGAPWT